MKLTEKKIMEKLGEVIDPELNISIVELGLIYDVKISKKEEVKITMTLTTIGCPLFSVIEQEVQNKLGNLKVPVEKIKLHLTFDPPWSMERMSERAKAQLGI